MKAKLSYYSMKSFCGAKHDSRIDVHLFEKNFSPLVFGSTLLCLAEGMDTSDGKLLLLIQPSYSYANLHDNKSF